MAGVPSDRPLLDSVVRSAGGDPSKVTVRNIGYTLGPALAAGKVDAVIGAYWNVEQIELERQGVEVEALRLEDNGVPDYDELVVVTSDETAATGPRWSAAFLKGAAHRARTGPPPTRPVPSRRSSPPTGTSTRRPCASPAAGDRASSCRPADEPTLTVDPAEWTRFAAWMRENGLLSKPVDVGRRRHRGVPPRRRLTLPAPTRAGPGTPAGAGGGGAREGGPPPPAEAPGRAAPAGRRASAPR